MLRTIGVLAVGTLGGAGLSQGFANSPQTTAPTSTTVPVVPIEQSQDAAIDAELVPKGDTVMDLIDGTDAITQAQTARAVATAGAEQADPVEFLRRQHDELYAFFLTYFYGWPALLMS